MDTCSASTRPLTLGLSLAGCGPAWSALTPEEATRVGGDLTLVGGGLSQLDQQLTGFKASVAKIVQAAPSPPEELEKVRETLAAGRDPQGMAVSSLVTILVLLTLWGVQRWLLFWKFLDVIMRPDLPEFRLLPMSDRAARAMKGFFGVGTFVGILNISLAPVALRAGLPIPSGQLIVLVVGVFVAACCVLGLLAYAASHRRTPGCPVSGFAWAWCSRHPSCWHGWSVS